MIRHCITTVLSACLLALLLVACTGDADKQTQTDGPSTQLTEAACFAHGVAASQCFICDAALRDPDRLWCGEHGRYEDRCFICHPELRDTNRLFCEEHGLYEDECFICHPD